MLGLGAAITGGVLWGWVVEDLWPIPALVGGSGIVVMFVASIWLVLRSGPTNGPGRLSHRDIIRIWEENKTLSSEVDELEQRNGELEQSLEDARSRLDALQQAHEKDQATIAKLGDELDELQDRLEKSQRIIEAVPRGLVEYYLHGEDRDEELAGQTRETVDELEAQWNAMDDSLSLRFVQPLLETGEQVAKDAAKEPPIHHYTPAEVAQMLKSIADRWRNDNWSIKAMRWLRLNYGPG